MSWEMLAKIRNTVREHDLLAGNSRALVAVSGGADSVALVIALRELAPEFGIELVMCHFNHRIRGKAASRDAAFVKNLAVTLKLPCVVGSGDVPRIARRNGVSIEMAAREARYRFFQQTAKKCGCDVLATGHNADDQVETFIIKLARGAGGAGLAGIPVDGVRGGLRVIRPMLDVRHSEAVSFLEARGNVWCEDVTNADVDILRNRVRSEIIPFLKTKLNPQIGPAIKRTAAILADENKWLDELAGRAWQKCRIMESVPQGAKTRRSRLYSIDVSKLCEYPRACIRRVVLKWLFGSGVPVHKTNFETVEKICDMINSGAGRRATNLCAGQKVVLKSGVMKIACQSSPVQREVFVKLHPPCEVLIEEQGLRIVLSKGVGFEKSRAGKPGDLPASAAVSLKKIGRRWITVRSWRAGDRMRPFGMSGGKKLKDIFIDAKVPLERRCEIPVFVCGSEIIWIPGYRIAAGWELAGQSEKSLVMSVEAGRVSLERARCDALVRSR